MKVLLIARSLTRGGAATGASKLRDALARAGAEVVAVPGDAGGRGALRTLERVVERVFFDAETHCLRLGAPAIDLAEQVRTHGPDIVQLCDISANTIAPDRVGALDAPSVHRMSDFWPYHGPRHYGDARDVAGLSGWLFRRAGFDRMSPSARVAPSHWLADNLNGPKARVIPNAVDLPAALKPRKIRYSPLSLGFISANLNDPRKGLARLEAPLRALPRARPVELVTFGAGTPPDLGVPMRNLGPFDPADRHRAMAEIDILLCPSERDTSPNTVSEALAHGIPVIGQRASGMETYVSDDRGALLDFWSDIPADLAGAIDRITGSYETMSRAARAFAEATLAPEVVGRAYLALYEQLLNPDAGPAKT